MKPATKLALIGMSREELRDGFVQVMQRCYRADACFQRLDAQFIDEKFKFTMHQLPYWAGHRWAWAKRSLFNYCRFLVVTTRLLRLVADKALRSRYRQQLLHVLRIRWREPHILFVYALKVATHYQYAAITRALARIEDGSGALPDAGRSFSRVKRQIRVQAAA